MYRLAIKKPYSSSCTHSRSASTLAWAVRCTQRLPCDTPIYCICISLGNSSKESQNSQSHGRGYALIGGVRVAALGNTNTSNKLLSSIFLNDQRRTKWMPGWLRLVDWLALFWQCMGGYNESVTALRWLGLLSRIQKGCCIAVWLASQSKNRCNESAASPVWQWKGGCSETVADHVFAMRRWAQQKVSSAYTGSGPPSRTRPSSPAASRCWAAPAPWTAQHREQLQPPQTPGRPRHSWRPWPRTPRRRAAPYPEDEGLSWPNYERNTPMFRA